MFSRWQTRGAVERLSFVSGGSMSLTVKKLPVRAIRVPERSGTTDIGRQPDDEETHCDQEGAS